MLNVFSCFLCRNDLFPILLAISVWRDICSVTMLMEPLLLHLSFSPAEEERLQLIGITQDQSLFSSLLLSVCLFLLSHSSRPPLFLCLFLSSSPSPLHVKGQRKPCTTPFQCSIMLHVLHAQASQVANIPCN